MENFVYLIHDHRTHRGAVVDPAWEPEQVVTLARNLGITISDVLLTHSHHDHVNGLETVLAAFDSQVHLLQSEASFWDSQLDRPTLHHGGDVISLGATELQILHTPGHTPGSACYRVADHLISGDTLFVYGCGRCDLKGGDPEQMFHTLKRLATELPAETVIHPGHHYAQVPVSTMAEQIIGNPFMHFNDLAGFVEYRMHRHDRVRQSPYGAIPRSSVPAN